MLRRLIRPELLRRYKYDWSGYKNTYDWSEELRRKGETVFDGVKGAAAEGSEKVLEAGTEQSINTLKIVSDKLNKLGIKKYKMSVSIGHVQISI